SIPGRIDYLSKTKPESDRLLASDMAAEKLDDGEPAQRRRKRLTKELPPHGFEPIAAEHPARSLDPPGPGLSRFLCSRWLRANETIRYRADLEKRPHATRGGA